MGNYSRIREYNAIDRRRPLTDDYLNRPDLPALGADTIANARRLEASGLTKPEIAEALRCNLRDVFRALLGESYLKEFAENRIPREDPQRETNADTIRGCLRHGARSVSAISRETALSPWYIKRVARMEGYSVAGDLIKARILPRTA